MITLRDKTGILIEALPYIQRYEQKTFVIKYGGAAMTDAALQENFAQDVSLLKKIGIRIVIVHGGGKEITRLAEKLGIPVRFVEGQRYTDAPMMEAVQMSLAGRTNQEIVGFINRHDGGAIGLTGVDGGLLRVRRHAPGGTDLGFVGEPEEVNAGLLRFLLDNAFLPVVAPIGVDAAWRVHNVNADLAASAVAAALGAEKLVYLSDVEGVSAAGKLIHSMTEERAEAWIAEGTINNGMIPKIRSAFDALRAGVGKVHMIDGRVPHSLLLEIFTRDGIGTELIRAEDEVEAKVKVKAKNRP